MSEILVHNIPPGWGLPTIGPFCLKLETWLRMVDLPYRAVVDATPYQGPKGKLPWIEHDGRKIGDSGFIMEYLGRRYDRDADARLSAGERAVAHAMRRLIEDSLYWTLVYDRWMVEENWPLSRQTILGRIPAVVRPLIAPVARRGVRKQLGGHGMGRHTREEVHAIGCADVAAVADLLAAKPFLMGEHPTSVDATAYGILANIAEVPLASPVKDEIRARENLVGYLARVRERYFG